LRKQRKKRDEKSPSRHREPPVLRYSIKHLYNCGGCRLAAALNTSALMFRWHQCSLHARTRMHSPETVTNEWKTKCILFGCVRISLSQRIFHVKIFFTVSIQMLWINERYFRQKSILSHKYACAHARKNAPFKNAKLEKWAISDALSLKAARPSISSRIQSQSPRCTGLPNFSTIVLSYHPVRFSTDNFVATISQIWLHRTTSNLVEKHKPIIEAISDVFLRFKTRSSQRQLGSKIGGQISHVFISTVKLGKGWAKCLSKFVVPDLGPTSNILLRKASRRTGRLKKVEWQKINESSTAALYKAFLDYVAGGLIKRACLWATRN